MSFITWQSLCISLSCKCVYGEKEGEEYIYIYIYTYTHHKGLCIHSNHACHCEKVGCLLGIVGACIRNLACDTK